MKYKVGPEGSQVAQKVNNDSASIFFTEATGVVFDDPIKTVDPFIEEFGQTMDTLTSELSNYTSLGDSIKEKLNQKLQEGYGALYNSVSDDLSDANKTLKSLASLFKTIDKVTKADVLDNATEMYGVITEDDMKLLSKLIDSDSSGQGLSSVTPQSLIENLLSNVTNRKGQKILTTNEIKKYAKDFSDAWDIITKSADFLDFIATRATMDTQKAQEYCNVLDRLSTSGTGLNERELEAARYFLRAETTDNPYANMMASIAEYVISRGSYIAVDVAEKQVAGANVANPYYWVVKATSTGTNFVGGTKGIVSNTRAMDAMYTNYERLYETYLDIKRQSEKNPAYRDEAMTALELCLMFNIKSSEYYLKTIESADSAIVAKFISLINDESLSDVNTLKEWIKDDISQKKALKETIENMH